MSKVTIGCFLGWIIACAGCNGDDSNGSSSTNYFLGRWSCSNETTINFTSPAIPALMQNGTSTLSITGSSSALTANDEGDASLGCPVTFTSNGMTATLKTGQTCALGPLTLSYKSGTATVSGNSLSSQFDFDATGQYMGVSAMATGTQKGACSRISPPPSGNGGGTTGGW